MPYQNVRYDNNGRSAFGPGPAGQVTMMYTPATPYLTCDELCKCEPAQTDHSSTCCTDSLKCCVKIFVPDYTCPRVWTAATMAISTAMFIGYGVATNGSSSGTYLALGIVGTVLCVTSRIIFAIHCAEGTKKVNDIKV